MTLSIRISDETKAKLEAVKRDSETFDELLARLAVPRTERDVRETAGGGGDGLADHMREKRMGLNDSLGERED